MNEAAGSAEKGNV
jgi:hypothetical protein